MEKKRPKIVCAKPGCKIWAMRDGSGFCYKHNPAYGEKRRKIQKEVTVRAYAKERTIEEKCKLEGCKGWPMLDGSGFCYNHNPRVAQERTALYVKNGKEFKFIVRPRERTCKIKGCQGWTVDDGEGFCHSHKPENIEKKRQQMKGNKYRLGQHMPWLGLKDINEARGLVFYSLIYDKPLLTLRALKKIVSLHARGEMVVPPKKDEGEMKDVI